LSCFVSSLYCPAAILGLRSSPTNE
jgi:hypothetical protein